jgi:hypothetical protein
MKAVWFAMVVLAGVLWILASGSSFENGSYTNREVGFALDLPEGMDETHVPQASFAVADGSGQETCVVLVQEVPKSVGARDIMKNSDQRQRDFTRALDSFRWLD